jgi:hypothetical protein
MTDNPDPNKGNPDPNAQGNEFLATLPAEIKDHPSLSTFKDSATLAKSYVEQQKLVGREKLPLPAKPYAESPDEYGIVFDRLGRPSDPAAYKMPEVEKVEGVPMASEQEIKDFQALSHKIGLMPHQVEALYKYNHERGVSYVKSSSEASTKARTDAEAGLRKEYGKAYDGNLVLAQTLIKKYGDEDTVAMIDSGMGNDPRFIKFMVNIAKQFGEDGASLAGEARTMTQTPKEAMAEIAKIRGECADNPKHPYLNKQHPEHKKMLDKMADLHKAAYPEEAPRT